MRAKEILLQDSINISKGNESILLKRQHQAQTYSFANRIRLASIALVPISLFYTISKRHTGRWVYRNIFFFNLLYCFASNIDILRFRTKLIKEFDCKESEFNSALFFYKNALLDR
jgi:hypothetical protein